MTKMVTGGCCEVCSICGKECWRARRLLLRVYLGAGPCPVLNVSDRSHWFFCGQSAFKTSNLDRPTRHAAHLPGIPDNFYWVHTNSVSCTIFIPDCDPYHLVAV
jgi:hypothetical protein